MPGRFNTLAGSTFRGYMKALRFYIKKPSICNFNIVSENRRPAKAKSLKSPNIDFLLMFLQTRIVKKPWLYQKAAHNVAAVV